MHGNLNESFLLKRLLELDIRREIKVDSTVAGIP
jgi:hypothetical protein